jgi:hypothetical protein
VRLREVRIVGRRYIMATSRSFVRVGLVARHARSYEMLQYCNLDADGLFGAE